MIRNNGITIDRANRTITHRGRSKQFVDVLGGNQKFIIACHLLLDAGISKEMLFWHLYENDLDGGPLSGEAHIGSQLSYVGEDLAKLKIEVRSWRVSGVTFYCAVPSFELSDPKLGWSNAKHIKRQNSPPNPSIANVAG